MSDAKLLIKEPLFARQNDGLRRTICDIPMMVDGYFFLVPWGFITDYSSWPSRLCPPPFYQIDLAGVFHDWCYRYGTAGLYGRKITFRESNEIWYTIARSGNGRTRASKADAIAGKLALDTFGYAAWRAARKRNRDAIVDFNGRINNNKYGEWSETIITYQICKIAPDDVYV